MPAVLRMYNASTRRHSDRVECYFAAEASCSCQSRFAIIRRISSMKSRGGRWAARFGGFPCRLEAIRDCSILDCPWEFHRRRRGVLTEQSESISNYACLDKATKITTHLSTHRVTSMTSTH